MIETVEDLTAGPLVVTEISATASREQAQIRPLSPGVGAQSSKKTKITTQARRDVEERAPATARALDYSNDESTKRSKASLPETSAGMLDYFREIEVWPDNEEQQAASMMLNGVDITEVFSPARVVKVCEKYGLIGGDSFDLRSGYDLSDPIVQAKVARHLQTAKPKLVIGSPPCTLFSRLQQLNLHTKGPEWAKSFEKRKVKAAEHISFCLRLFRLQ